MTIDDEPRTMDEQMEERLFNGEERDEEVGFDASLRPLSLAEFVGQESRGQERGQGPHVGPLQLQ